jgi:DNA-binding MarR family transcriptional regulator
VAYAWAVKQPGRNISLLFDLFVLNQRVRRLLALALADVELRADQYAVYSLLFEQGPLTATEMARRMGMPLTTVLDYLKSMDRRKHPATLADLESAPAMAGSNK